MACLRRPAYLMSWNVDSKRHRPKHADSANMVSSRHRVCTWLLCIRSPGSRNNKRCLMPFTPSGWRRERHQASFFNTRPCAGPCAQFTPPIPSKLSEPAVCEPLPSGVPVGAPVAAAAAGAPHVLACHAWLWSHRTILVSHRAHFGEPVALPGLLRLRRAGGTVGQCGYIIMM